MYENLAVIHWPDPRLKQPCLPVIRFDDRLRLLANRMLHLMREAQGVGLAAPQVGINIRMFVMNPTGQPQDDWVYVNPQLSEADGEEETDEGCLSLPGIYIPVIRYTSMRMNAFDLDGNPIEQVESGYLTRIWQHEVDHLNGTLLTDRMGALAKLSNRKKLKDLRSKYQKEHPGEPGKPLDKQHARLGG